MIIVGHWHPFGCLLITSNQNKLVFVLVNEPAK